MPALTQERRQELVKVVKKMAEEARSPCAAPAATPTRCSRKPSRTATITEDDERKGLKKVQETTDKAVARSTRSSRKKEAEILEV